MVHLPYALPEDFTVGVGTSAWQVECATASRGRTIWDDFSAVPGAIVDGIKATKALLERVRTELTAKQPKDGDKPGAGKADAGKPDAGKEGGK